MTAAKAAYLLGLAAAGQAFAAGGGTLLHDDFNGPSVDPTLWHIPTFTASGDGTFVGRTQFRVTEDSGLPATSRGTLVVPIESYNPKQPSFLAGELISNQAFSAGKGIDVIVRARMNAPLRPGIVGGLFLYALAPGSNTLHDEIDFELLSNVPDKVQTNMYGNEPLGVGHVEFVPYRNGSMTEFHDYEIKWTPKSVSWLIDGQLVRTVTSNIPIGPMRYYLNLWAPDPAWPGGYSAAIQPVRTASENETVGSLLVDTVTVRALERD
jgi:beta-glucanase (GH16 family)